MKLDKELYEEIANLTGTEYDVQYRKDADYEYVDIYNNHTIESLLENLLGKYKQLEEKYDETEKYYIDNWQPIPISSQVNINDKDFM